MTAITTDLNLANRSIIIFGMGTTGLSVARFLTSMNIPFAMADTRKSPENLSQIKTLYPKINLFLGPLLEEYFTDTDLVITSPGISSKDPNLQAFHDRGIQIIGDLELFLSSTEATVVAITGSNGKSTVTTLVGEMALASGLKVSFGGNLGTPMLDLLVKNSEIYVLELSSFQLELISDMRGAIVCLLNVSADHMDRYNSIEDYAKAKQNIFLGASKVIVNRQDQLANCSLSAGSILTTFGLDIPNYGDFGVMKTDDGSKLCCGKNHLIQVSEIAIQGRHNQANALAAMAIGSSVGFDQKAMISILLSFKGLAHRCEVVTTINGVLYVDDSKGTNVGATVAAIESYGSLLTRNIVLLAGGQGKNQDFSDLQSAVEKFVKYGVVFGENADQIEEALHPVTEVLRAGSLDNAVKIAKQVAIAGDIVLLSPACSSFDAFSGFEHRGQHFQSAVLSDRPLLSSKSSERHYAN